MPRVSPVKGSPGSATCCDCDGGGLPCRSLALGGGRVATTKGEVGGGPLRAQEGTGAHSAPAAPF